MYAAGVECLRLTKLHLGGHCASLLVLCVLRMLPFFCTYMYCTYIQTWGKKVYFVPKAETKTSPLMLLRLEFSLFPVSHFISFHFGLSA